MTTLPELCERAQHVLITAAQKAARITGFTLRRSKLSGEQFAQILVFGWLSHAQSTLEQLAQMGAALGVEITPQAIDQRFTPQTSAFLKALLSEALRQKVEGKPAGIELLSRFREVDIVDSTVVHLPETLADLWLGHGGGRTTRTAEASAEGTSEALETPEVMETGGKTGAKRTASIKLSVRWNLKNGQLIGPELMGGRVHDRNANVVATPLPLEALRIADLGFWCLNELARLDRQGVFWLSRLKANTGFREADRNEWTLGSFLASPKAGSKAGTQGLRDGTLELPIQLGLDHQLPCRLLAVRVPPDVAANRRRELHQKLHRREENRRKRAKKVPSFGQKPATEGMTQGMTEGTKDLRKGEKLTGSASTGGLSIREQEVLCDWNVYVTNVPVERLTLSEAIVLLRLRWQIEMLFKLWKSEFLIDEWRSRKPWRILCELYAKLLGALLQHWILVVCAWEIPDRSLFKAAQSIRRWTWELALRLYDVEAFCQILTRIQSGLAQGCRLTRRRKKPSSFQLLDDPDLLGLA